MSRRTPITFIFLLLCLLVSIPGAFVPAYFELFSGELPHEHWWQKFSMAFQHGAAGNPASILLHLTLNMILLLTCGRLTEKLLGSTRFLVLSLAAWSVFILIQWTSGIWINGSSGIIWAYSPFLLLPIKWAREEQNWKRYADQSRLLLILMWVLVTLFMGFIPLLFNPEHSLLHTFLFGNLYHASATIVGFLFYLSWRRQFPKLRRSLNPSDPE